MMRVLIALAFALGAVAGCADRDEWSNDVAAKNADEAAQAELPAKPEPDPEPRLNMPRRVDDAAEPRIRMSVPQRTTTPVVGSDGAVKLTVDDVTRGQVMTSVAVEEEGLVAGPHSLSPGDTMTFTLDGRRYRLELTHLQNVLVGEDTATFAITEVTDGDGDGDDEGDQTTPGDPADPEAGASTDDQLTEREKIDRLLEHIATLEEASFIRNGVPYDGEEAAAHLRRKWRFAGDRITTAEQFVEHLASRSSQSGEPYVIEFADGRRIEAGVYLNGLLDEMD